MWILCFVCDSSTDCVPTFGVLIAQKLIEDDFITYIFRGLSKDKEEPTTYEILKIAYEIYKEDCQVVTTAKKLKEMGISKWVNNKCFMFRKML